MIINSTHSGTGGGAGSAGQPQHPLHSNSGNRRVRRFQRDAGPERRGFRSRQCGRCGGRGRWLGGVGPVADEESARAHFPVRGRRIIRRHATGAHSIAVPVETLAPFIQLVSPHILLVFRVPAGGVGRAGADVDGATQVIIPIIAVSGVSGFERIRVCAGAARSDAGLHTALAHINMYVCYEQVQRIPSSYWMWALLDS